MPSKYDFTELKNADSRLKEVAFMPSTIENIDTALYNHIRDELALQTTTNKGNITVPVLWVAAERAHQIKNSRDQDIRDRKGIFKLPLMTVERASMTKDPAFKGTWQAHMPDFGTGLRKIRRVNVPAAARINQVKTSNFANAFAARRAGANNDVGVGQLNFPIKTKKKDPTVIQTLYQPIPIWVNATYNLRIRTEYVQQMNDLIQPFYTFTGQANSFFITNEGHRYEAFVEGDISYSNNTTNYGEEERTYITDIKLKVLGYLMGEGVNDPKPKITMIENFVDVKIPRERVIVGDINDSFREDEEAKGFYRE